MERGLTGHYVDSVAGGVRCQAFIPDSLPPEPPLALDGKLQGRINQAMRRGGAAAPISPRQNLDGTAR